MKRLRLVIDLLLFMLSIWYGAKAFMHGEPEMVLWLAAVIVFANTAMTRLEAK